MQGDFSNFKDATQAVLSHLASGAAFTHLSRIIEVSHG
jgi:anthranilate phosphoribosyltransferase